MTLETPSYPRREVTRGEGARSSAERAEELEALAQRLDTLADTNRLRVLHLLQTCGEMCVCELQDALGLTAPNLSFHLQVLRLAGFVRSRKDGKWVFYRILPHAAREVGAAISALFAGEPPEGTSSACPPDLNEEGEQEEPACPSR